MKNAIWIFFCLIFYLNTPAFAAPIRVAILPFDMHAEKDLAFLREGIMDMLGSRLAWRDKVEVINKSETKAALSSAEGFDGASRALLVGGKLQADYVLFGSLTVLGESVSIDAKMVDVTGQQESLPFFAQTSSMGEVIPQINQFATNINETVFGRAAVQRPTGAPVPQAATVPAPQAQPAPEGFDPRMHPEKLLQSGVQPGTQPSSAAQAPQAPNPAFIAAGPAETEERTYWKSRSVKSLITGIDIGDVDNDGRQEIVIVQDKAVTINRVENGRLVKIAEATTIRTGNYLAVDVGDANGNGTPEIYVTGTGPQNNVIESFVLEHDGTKFSKIDGPDNWYYRITDSIEQGTIVLGQRQLSNDDSVFNGAIHKMQWQGDQLAPGPQLLRGKLANLIGATYGDITQTGQSEIAAYSDWDRLRIYGVGNQMIWEDADRSGGNMIFFTLSKADPGQDNQQYFPLRVRITDIDKDGQAEVLVARHAELAQNMLKNFRSFKNGYMELMEWNGRQLISKWKTQEFSGRISDFAVGDFDNDGSDELVIAIVSKEGAIVFTDAISNVIAFELDVQ